MKKSRKPRDLHLAAFCFLTQNLEQVLSGAYLTGSCLIIHYQLVVDLGQFLFHAHPDHPSLPVVPFR